MAVIEQICAFIHNYFVHGKEHGIFTISNGSIELPFLVPGQYFRICGSRMNDGVYQYGAADLTDETFEGEIWDMRLPRSFLVLAKEIEAWNEKYADTVTGPYQSESFGGYSYSLKTGYSAGSGVDSNAAGWQGVFKTRLNQWRKLA